MVWWYKLHHSKPGGRVIVREVGASAPAMCSNNKTHYSQVFFLGFTVDVL